MFTVVMATFLHTLPRYIITFDGGGEGPSGPEYTLLVTAMVEAVG